MDTKQINIRYSELATSDCCLSCGSAANLSDPQAGEICVDLGSGKGTDAIRLAKRWDLMELFMELIFLMA